MTCLIASRARGLAERRAVTRLLALTRCVRRRSRARLAGTFTIVTEPRIVGRVDFLAMYARSPVVQSPIAYGPTQRAGLARAVLTVVTTRWRPPGLTSTSVGS